MRRVWRTAVAVVAATIALGACGPFGGVPPVVIDGVDGRAISSCTGNTCADGALAGEGLPSVEHPVRVSAPAGAHIEAIEAYDDAYDPSPTRVTVKDGTLGPIPASARILWVFVTLDGGGDASYAWSIGPQSGGSSPSAARGRLATKG